MQFVGRYANEAALFRLAAQNLIPHIVYDVAMRASKGVEGGRDLFRRQATDRLRGYLQAGNPPLGALDQPRDLVVRPGLLCRAPDKGCGLAG